MVFMIGSCRSIQACPGFSTVTYITAGMKPQSAGAALHPAALRASGVASIAELPFGFRQEFIEGNIMKRPRRKFLLLAAESPFLEKKEKITLFDLREAVGICRLKWKNGQPRSKVRRPWLYPAIAAVVLGWSTKRWLAYLEKQRDNLMGLVLTGLLGAFMGTFSGTLNAAQAYIVNDIYLKYVNPKATNRQTIYMNYLAGFFVVATGVVLGLFVKDVNTVLQWIVSGLYGGYVASNMLKWHWWRFNANGFFWGMLAGIVPAIALAVLKYEDVLHGLDLWYWPVLFFLSLIGSVVGSYATPPTDAETLKSFYKTVRPWGFWKPVHEKVLKEDPAFVGNKNFRLNAFNIALGMIGQMCLTILPMYVVLWLKLPLLITAGILLIIIVILKRTWWDRLNEY